MARYIDADALQARLEAVVEAVKKQGKNRHIRGILFGTENALGLVEEAPTIDARPVVRGKWRMETDEEEPNPMFKLPVCCVCEKTGGMSVFCPNCGADMRGDGDG